MDSLVRPQIEILKKNPLKILYSYSHAFIIIYPISKSDRIAILQNNYEHVQNFITILNIANFGIAILPGHKRPENCGIDQVVPGAEVDPLPRPEVAVGGRVELALAAGTGSTAADHEDTATAANSGTRPKLPSFS